MKHKSEDIKFIVILNYFESKNQNKASKIFGCSPRTLMRWVIKFKNYNSFKKNYSGYKIKQIHINYINNCLLQNKMITIKKLKENLMLRFSLNIAHYI